VGIFFCAHFAQEPQENNHLHALRLVQMSSMQSDRLHWRF